jgi:hypothetical protein
MVDTIEIDIDGKKFHFRNRFMCADFCEIGVPLMQMDKFKVIGPDIDPTTSKPVVNYDMSPEKMEPEDMRALHRWNKDLMTRMSADKINWSTSEDIYAFNCIERHPDYLALTAKYMQAINPKAVLPEIQPEKKKNT